MSRPHIHRPGSWSKAPLTVLVVMAAAATLLAACGGSAGSLPPGKSGSIRVGTPTKTASVPAKQSARQQQSAQIVAAWQAAEDAFETAAHTADPFAPAIRATTVLPAQLKMMTFLQSMRTAGYIATGPVKYGRSVVLSINANAATVRTCDWDAEVVLSATTGQHALGAAGAKDFDLITATMAKTADGWKLADQTAGLGKCHQA
jgi:hypothetical protein